MNPSHQGPRFGGVSSRRISGVVRHIGDAHILTSSPHRSPEPLV